jgi:hypothetical protein
MIRGIGPVYAKKLVRAFGDVPRRTAASQFPVGRDHLTIENSVVDVQQAAS